MAFNEVAASVTGLYTTLRNMLSTEKFFSFFPPHGRRLAAGEEITVLGDLGRWIQSKRFDGRARRSFEAALAAGSLVIVKTPDVILYDETLDVSKKLSLDNSAFSDVDPDWGAYSSSM